MRSGYFEFSAFRNGLPFFTRNVLSVFLRSTSAATICPERGSGPCSKDVYKRQVHAYPGSSLPEAEALGVTTVLDMFCDPANVRHDKAEEGSGAGLAGADIYSAGIAATVPHGHGTEYGFDIPTLTTPAEAQDWVDARIAEGSDLSLIHISNTKTA